MEGSLLLNAGIDLQVGEFGEPSTRPAHQVVVVRPFGKLVAHAPIFQRHAAEQVELLQQLDGPEDGGPPDRRDLAQQIFDGERAGRPFDGLEHGPPRRGGAKSDGLKPCRRSFGECHGSMVTIPFSLLQTERNRPMITAVLAGVVTVSDIALLKTPRQLVIFRVGTTDYALDIEVVDEILPVLPITPVAGAAPGILGIADVRKRVVPVFDLHARLGSSRPADESESRLVLVDGDDGPVAFLVDAVEEVLTVPREAFQHVDPPGDRRGLAYLNGIVRHEDRLVLWVDHRRLAPEGAAALAA